MNDLATQIDLLLEGELSESDAAALYDRARVEPEVADALALATMLHTQIAEQLTADRSAAVTPDDGKKGTGDRAQETVPISAAGVPMYRKGYEPQPFKLRARHYALIAATLLAACGVAVYLLAFSAPPSDIEPRTPNIEHPPVATLIQNTGNLRTPADYPVEGESSGAGEYTLDRGSAEFMLTNAVNVKLRGETRMHMRNDMNVSLTRGSAEFVVPKDAKGFTVHLPGETRVVDLGTRFEIDADEAGHTDIRVIEGEVRLERKSGEIVTLIRGQIARTPHTPDAPITYVRTIVADIGGDWGDASVFPENWHYLRSTAVHGGTETLLTANTSVGNGGNTGFGSPGEGGFYGLPAVIGDRDGSNEYELFADGYEGTDGGPGNRGVVGVDLLVHPGNSLPETAPPHGDPFLILRYTVSDADVAHGTHAKIEGGFRNLITHRVGPEHNSVSVFVVHNGKVLFSASGDDPAGKDGRIETLGREDGAFDVSADVAVGDTLDFAVATNGALPTDETAVHGRILMSPAPMHETEPDRSDRTDNNTPSTTTP